MRIRYLVADAHALVGLGALILALGVQHAYAQKIGGTGRIQPAGGVIQVWGPRGVEVERVLVKEGDRVKFGATLFTLGERRTREIEEGFAAKRLQAVESQGASRMRLAELELQSAKLAERHAAADLDQLGQLNDKLSSERERRQRAQALESAQSAVRVANARIEDLRTSIAADRRAAHEAIELARSHLSRTVVTAPLSATVLEVSVRAGTTLGQTAALTLGDTATMHVEADVFEGDLPKIKTGMAARATNPALGTQLAGSVVHIGRLIDPKARTGKVLVRLDQPAPADRFIGMQVDVTIVADGTVGK
jgi:multidrug efflux pump subunit AcrA (membrane-fusion protein)